MFMRMQSYGIGWHVKQALAWILFQDNDKPAAANRRQFRLGGSVSVRLELISSKVGWSGRSVQRL
jgi:hypothetical protein